MLCSVVIPLYNKEAFIEKAVRSVLDQSYGKFEVVVVDDGSRDAGAAKVRAIEDPRIRLVRQDNQGVSAARNRGIELARGDIVCLLDADDWYHPGFLRQVVAMAERHPGVGFFATAYRRVSHGTRERPPDHEQDAGEVLLLPDIYREWRRRGAFFCASSVAFRRSLLLAEQPCFPVGDSLGEDQDFWFRAGEKGTLAYCTAPLATYRIDVAGSLSSVLPEPSLSPVYRRLEMRIRRNEVPAKLRYSAMRMVDHGKVSVARELLQAGRRRQAFRQVLAGWRDMASRRWWITLGMCVAASPSFFRRWEAWRGERAAAKWQRPAPAPVGAGAAGGADSGRLVVLSVIRDPLPPTRPDVLTLFGKELPKLGIRSILIGQFENRPDPFRWAGGGAQVLGWRGGMLATVLIPLWDLSGALRILARRSIHCVQVRDKIFSAVVFYCLARLIRRPFVYWMSFPFVESHESRLKHVGRTQGLAVWLANLLRARLSRLIFYRGVLPRAQHVFVQSESMRDWLAAKGIERARMTAVPMGVDTDMVQRRCIAPATDSRLDGRRVIIYSGVLSKDRESAFLLDLVAALEPHQPDILLVLAGDAPSGDERAWIRDEIARRKLDELVVLTGWIGQYEAMGYAVRAEIGLSPIPRGELFDVSSPTKLIEYLAIGLPAVANDIPDQKLVVERSGAALCVPMRVDAFCDAVLQLLNDPALCRRLARRGPEYVHAERAYRILAPRVARKYREIAMDAAGPGSPRLAGDPARDLAKTVPEEELASQRQQAH